jgi:hypothetical protein
MKGCFMKKITLVCVLLSTTICSSCTSIKFGIEYLRLDFDGTMLLENEAQVKSYLEDILLNPENYSMIGYTRKVLSAEVKKTPVYYHSYYVVYYNDLPFFFTLSFSGTKKSLYSKGAWAINTAMDIRSYISYRYDINEWDVEEIPTDNGINTEMTLKNIIYRIDSNITYYYNDHRKSKDNMENCNTALINTLVEND